MKKLFVALAATAALAAGATPAVASTYSQQSARAWHDITYSCLRFAGCSHIYRNQVNTKGTCHQWHYGFHTTYYGWLDGLTNWYC